MPFARTAAITLSIVRAVAAVAVAATPFDGTSWPQLLARDATIRIDRTYTPERGTAYYDRADRFGGILYPDADVVVGRAGGEWLAAVPLASGGTIGISGWLIYAPHRARHIAVVPGSLGLSFEHGTIVTVDPHGPRVNHLDVETTYGVHGTVLTKIGRKTIRD